MTFEGKGKLRHQRRVRDKEEKDIYARQECKQRISQKKAENEEDGESIDKRREEKRTKTYKKLNPKQTATPPKNNAKTTRSAVAASW